MRAAEARHCNQWVGQYKYLLLLIASMLCFLIAIERESIIAMTLVHIIVIFLHYLPHCRPCHHHGHNQFLLPAPAQCTSAAQAQATPHRAETFYSLELHNIGHRRTQLQTLAERIRSLESSCQLSAPTLSLSVEDGQGAVQGQGRRGHA